SRRRHTRSKRDWSSDVCSSDLEGGTHLSGFKNALTNTFNKYARANKLLKENEPALSGEDIREGLTAIISVKIEDPQFEGQTKQKIGRASCRKRDKRRNVGRSLN